MRNANRVKMPGSLACVCSEGCQLIFTVPEVMAHKMALLAVRRTRTLGGLNVVAMPLRGMMFRGFVGMMPLYVMLCGQENWG